MAHDASVTLTPVPQDHIGLDRDGCRAAAEVQRRRWHFTAQVVDVEDELVIKDLPLLENHPAEARRHQTKLVAGRIYRLDSWKTKIPLVVRIEEWIDEAA